MIKRRLAWTFVIAAAALATALPASAEEQKPMGARHLGGGAG